MSTVDIHELPLLIDGTKPPSPACDLDPIAGGSKCAPVSGLDELQRQHAKLAAENAALRERLLAFHLSSTWRVLCICQSAALRLFPTGTKRRQLAIEFWRTARRMLKGHPGLRSADANGAPAPDCGRTPLFESAPPLVAARAAREHKFRVAYIGHAAASEAASLRYRAHNLIEALALKGVEAAFVPEENIPERLREVLAYDLIVLVRRRWTRTIDNLVRAARQLGIPLVFDLDDYVFDSWVLPYMDFSRDGLADWTLQYIDSFRETIENCDYFTGATRFLVERAELADKPSWVIRNGLNSAQLALCQLLVERPPPRSRGTITIGYFCGSKTHQADFRIAYRALMWILQEFHNVRLLVVGEIDLHLFPGLQPFRFQVEHRARVDWRDLPILIASVDINIVPLEVNPFTEGKSDLKYYEAGILKVPTIASPTRSYAGSICHGWTGLLANSDEEWYRALKLLVTDIELRRRLGEQAHAHALRAYTPPVIAEEAINVYRAIIHLHRQRRGVAPGTLSLSSPFNARQRAA